MEKHLLKLHSMFNARLIHSVIMLDGAIKSMETQYQPVSVGSYQLIAIMVATSLLLYFLLFCRWKQSSCYVQRTGWCCWTNYSMELSIVDGEHKNLCSFHNAQTLLLFIIIRKSFVCSIKVSWKWGPALATGKCLSYICI